MEASAMGFAFRIEICTMGTGSEAMIAGDGMLQGLDHYGLDG